MDRLARSTKDLLSIANEINKEGCRLGGSKHQFGYKIPDRTVDAHHAAPIAEFEKGIMLERQREDIDIAKEDGKHEGRKPIEETKLQQVQTLVEGGKSVSKAVSKVDIGRRTYYKAIEEGRI